MVVVTWKRAFFFGLAISLALVLWLAYWHIDLAVSHSYLQQSYGEVQADVKLLAEAFPKDRYNKRDIVHVLRRSSPDAFIVESECAVQVGGLRFEFSAAGNLLRVNPNAPYEPEPSCGT